MLATLARQMRYATQVIRGRPLDDVVLRRLVADAVDTIAEYGEIPLEQADMLPGAVEADAEVRRTLAERRLRRLTTVARTTTPWYIDRLPDGRDLTLETFGALPVTTKADLRADPEAFVSRRGSPTLAVHTTGTTGVPTRVWFSRHEVELLSALNALGLLVTGGIRPDDVYLLCGSSRSTLATTVTQRSLALIGAGCVPLGIVEPRLAVERLAASVHLPGRQPRPTRLVAHPSYLAAMLDVVEREGWSARDFGLRTVFSGGEVLTDVLADRVRAAFGAEVVDNYGMTEIAPTSGVVCEDKHLHVPQDTTYVEVLDPVTRAPAAPGGLATLVASPYLLYRDTTLLVRFDTGDLVRALPEQEPTCSMRRVPATSRLLGRLLDGQTSITTRDVLDVLEGVAAVPLPARFALRSVAGEVELHVLVRSAGPAARRALEAAVARCGLALDRLVLSDDVDRMPPTFPVRADLREHSFERVRGRPGMQVAVSATAPAGVPA